MTQAQRRAVALSAARYQLRRLHLNPVDVSAEDAHAALDDYARLYRNMVASEWYRVADEVQLTLFYRDWVAWQRRSREQGM